MSLILNPYPPGKERWVKTEPPGSGNVRISEGCPGGWSVLALTDTLEHKIPFCRFFWHFVKTVVIRNIRVNVWSNQKYKFCLSVTSIVAIAALLLRSASRFFKGKIARNGQFRLEIGLNLKYHNQHLQFVL